jgi:hypothetical protein
MARLRCTLEQAKAEAIRMASEFLQTTPAATTHRFVNARPDNSSPKVDSGKIPAVWLVMFSWSPSNGEVIDGGEVFIRVNVQTKNVEYRHFV